MFDHLISHQGYFRMALRNYDEMHFDNSTTAVTKSATHFHLFFALELLLINLLHVTLNAPIATKVVCFSCLLTCLRSLYGKRYGPRSDCSYIGAVCSGYTLFAYTLNSSVMLGNNLQQSTSADDIFRCIFFLAL